MWYLKFVPESSSPLLLLSQHGSAAEEAPHRLRELDYAAGGYGPTQGVIPANARKDVVWLFAGSKQRLLHSGRGTRATAIQNQHSASAAGTPPGALEERRPGVHELADAAARHRICTIVHELVGDPHKGHAPNVVGAR